MMFGQLIFADIPVADHGEMPHLDTGWHDTHKDECGLSGWSKRPADECNMTVVDKPETIWEIRK